MTTRRILALAALGLVAYALFLAATMPAAYVATRLPPALELIEPRGTLWNGTARGLLRTPNGPLALDGVEWRFAPAALLSGRMAFDLHATARGLDVRARLAHGIGGLSASDIAAQADAALAATYLPLLSAWKPQGAITLQAPRLAWDAREIRGEARAEWRGATLSLPDPRALGTYRAELRGDGGPARLDVSTLEGALQVKAAGTVTPARVELKGEARAQGPQADALAPLLDLLGPRRPDGARDIVLRTP